MTVLNLCDVHRFVITHYDEMKPYFALDPLLHAVFVSLTPDTEFPDLCKRVPSYLTSAWVAHNILETNTSKKMQVYMYFQDINACVWDNIIICA